MASLLPGGEGYSVTFIKQQRCLRGDEDLESGTSFALVCSAALEDNMAIPAKLKVFIRHNPPLPLLTEAWSSGSQRVAPGPAKPAAASGNVLKG